MTTPNTTTTIATSPISHNSFDLSRDCALIGIEASLYPWSKKDTIAAAHAADAEAADAQRFTAYIQRLSKEDRLPPQQLIGEARKALAFPNGSPWDGKGFFLVPNTRLETILDTLEQYRTKFYRAVDELVAKLPELEAKARLDLNGAFDRLGFPTADELRERYTFAVRQGAIASPDDIRLNHVSPKARLAIEDAVRREHQDQAGALHKACIDGITSALRRVVDSLPKFSAGEVTRFEDTLFTGLQEITEALPALNLGNDATINKAITQTRSLVATLTAANEKKVLRNKNPEGDETRKVIAGQAKSILDSLKGGAVTAAI